MDMVNIAKWLGPTNDWYRVRYSNNLFPSNRLSPAKAERARPAKRAMAVEPGSAAARLPARSINAPPPLRQRGGLDANQSGKEPSDGAETKAARVARLKAARERLPARCPRH